MSNLSKFWSFAILLTLLVAPGVQANSDISVKHVVRNMLWLDGVGPVKEVAMDQDGVDKLIEQEKWPEELRIALDKVAPDYL